MLIVVGESYSSAEMQSEYSEALGDSIFIFKIFLIDQLRVCVCVCVCVCVWREEVYWFIYKLVFIKRC